MDIANKSKLSEAFKSKDNQEISDVQYEIWATFLKSTGQNLRNKELRLMADSTKLIESLQNSKSIQRQQDSTEGSVSSHRQVAFDRQSLNRFSSPQSRILSRKSPRANNKVLNFAYCEELRDIEENCNASTIKWVKNLLKDHQKVKDKILDVQTNQKRLKRNIENLQKEHEHYIILKKIHEQVQKKNNRLENEISELKTKNKALMEQVQNIQARNQKSVVTDSKAITNLISFLEDKQKIVNAKMDRIIEIEANVMEIARSNITESGCDKCCSLIRRIKDAMVKLRHSLQEQSKQVQNLYNKYKTAFCGNSY